MVICLERESAEGVLLFMMLGIILFLHSQWVEGMLAI
jgi:hypothetical protein